MIRRPPRSTRTYTLFPYTTLFRSLKTLFGKVVFELVVITLGVLIALGINAWYNNYQQAQQANALLSKIEYELANNISQLKRVQNGYQENIEKVVNYEQALADKGELKGGTQFVLIMLNIEQGAWQFSKTRSELNTLPVELLMVLNLAHRSSFNAQEMVREFIFQQHDDLSQLQDDRQEDYLSAVDTEFKQIKFNIDLALVSSEQALERVKEFQQTGQLSEGTKGVSLSTEV